MTKHSPFHLLSICGLLLLAFGSEVSAQRTIAPVVPLTAGQRALRFIVDTNGARHPERFVVTVFYSNDPAKLENLDDPALPRGRPVLQFSRNGFLDATFVFPHDDAIDPNRLLYRKHKRERGMRIVTYADVDRQYDPRSSQDVLSYQGDSPLDTNPKIYRKECVFYRVQLRPRVGEPIAFTSALDYFSMPDTFNVGLVGDSYGSGEGAPGSGNNKWRHEDCHRSNNSGLVRGVKRFIHDNPDVAIDYLHRACSGATMNELLNPQSGNYHEFAEEVPAQFDELESDLLEDGNHDEMHLLVMSVGGNDAGFGDYLINYIVGFGNAATEDGKSEEILHDVLSLRDAYRALNSDITDRFPIAQVAIATYPDPTNGRYGVCGKAPGPIEYHWEYSCCELEVNPVTNPPEEYEFTANHFIDPLNSTIRDAADRHGWRVVAVDKRMGRHGICDCSDPYINTYGGSVSTQGDIYGFMHPNKKGYREVYETPVAKIVSAAFDDFAERRTMEIATATTLDEESAVVPPICTPTPIEGVGDLREPPALFSSIFINPPEWMNESKPFKDLLSDKDARAALVKGDLAQLKKLPAYHAFVARRAELLPLLNATKARRSMDTTNTRPATLPPLPPAVLKARTEARTFLKSQQIKELDKRVKATLDRHPVVVVKDDLLDSLYNRPR